METLASGPTHEDHYLDQQTEGSVEEPLPEPFIVVRALYAFHSEDPASLSFQKGELIQVLTQLESGWWYGYCPGARGWFPSNYVQVLSEDSEDDHHSVDTNELDEEDEEEQDDEQQDDDDDDNQDDDDDDDDHDDDELASLFSLSFLCSRRINTDPRGSMRSKHHAHNGIWPWFCLCLSDSLDKRRSVAAPNNS